MVFVRPLGQTLLKCLLADFYTQLYSTAFAFPQPSVVGQQAFFAITVAEIVRAIKSLKSGRASSDDGLLAEMLKIARSTCAGLFLVTGRRSEVPTDWLVNE